VAANLRALGADPVLVSVVGDDADGKVLCRALARPRRGAAPRGHRSRAAHHGRRPASSPTRSRWCAPTASRAPTLDGDALTRVANAIDDELPGCEAMVVSDYGKGVVHPRTLDRALLLARKAKVPVCVDPKESHIDHYKGVSILTPNQHEAGYVMGRRIVDEASLLEVGWGLQKRLDAGAVLVTRGPQGMSLFERGGRITHLPTAAREVYDVTGAGDTVVSVVALGARRRRRAAQRLLPLESRRRDRDPRGRHRLVPPASSCSQSIAGPGVSEALRAERRRIEAGVACGRDDRIHQRRLRPAPPRPRRVPGGVARARRSARGRRQLRRLGAPHQGAGAAAGAGGRGAPGCCQALACVDLAVILRRGRRPRRLIREVEPRCAGEGRRLGRRTASSAASSSRRAGGRVAQRAAARGPEHHRAHRAHPRGKARSIRSRVAARPRRGPEPSPASQPPSASARRPLAAFLLLRAHAPRGYRSFSHWDHPRAARGPPTTLAGPLPHGEAHAGEVSAT
jgi:rfaE bifunctional protein kinase chain/domain